MSKGKADERVGAAKREPELDRRELVLGRVRLAAGLLIWVLAALAAAVLWSRGTAMAGAPKLLEGDVIEVDMDATPTAGAGVGARRVMTADDKDCPECGETIRAAARLCRFCGYRFDDRPRREPTPDPASTEATPGTTEDVERKEA